MEAFFKGFVEIIHLVTLCFKVFFLYQGFAFVALLRRIAGPALSGQVLAFLYFISKKTAHLKGFLQALTCTCVLSSTKAARAS